MAIAVAPLVSFLDWIGGSCESLVLFEHSYNISGHAFVGETGSVTKDMVGLLNGQFVLITPRHKPPKQIIY